jgi:hypothetical protein
MMDEVMVGKCISPLLLQAIFFMMQNVGIPFQNYSTKWWNSTQNEVAKIHLQPNKCSISSSCKKPKAMFY